MPLPLKHIARAFLLVALLAGLSGCASVSVEDPQMATRRLSAPPVIYVRPFALSRAAQQELPAEIESKTVQQLALGTVKAVNRYAGKAVLLPDGYHPKAARYWIIEGTIERVALGKRELRATVGFGLGATKVETLVRISEVEHGMRQQILAFRTTGGSNSSPGGLFTLATGTFITAAISTGLGMFPGLTADLERTAYEIAAQLSDFQYDRGILRKKYQHVSPKKEGEIPTQINFNRIVPAIQ